MRKTQAGTNAAYLTQKTTRGLISRRTERPQLPATAPAQPGIDPRAVDSFVQPGRLTSERRQCSVAHLFQVLAHALQELGAVRILHHLLCLLHILAPLLLCSFQCRVPLPHGAGLAHQELLGIPDGDPFCRDVAPDAARKRQACSWLCAGGANLQASRSPLPQSELSVQCA